MVLLVHAINSNNTIEPTWKVAFWLKPAAPLSVLRSAPQFLFHLEAFEMVEAEGF